MSDISTEDFFASVGGSGAPSAVLKEIGDTVFGTIVSQSVIDAKKFGTDEVERDSKSGEPIKQLAVVLQTDLRNWAGVSKIPLIDKDDASKGKKPPSEDDGTRAVYLKQWTNIQAAVAEAIVKATGKRGALRDGGRLGVKVIELKDTGKGNPLKIHAAFYEAPAEGADFFGGQPAQSAPAAAPAAPAPAPQAAPPAAPAPQAPAPQPVAVPAAPAAQDPWASQAPGAAPGAAPAAPAPAAQDPWGAPQAQSTERPPF